MGDGDDLTGQEKSAKVAWLLAQGRPLSTREIAQHAGLSLRGARWLLARIARVVPIYRDDDDRWALCPESAALFLAGFRDSGSPETLKTRGGDREGGTMQDLR